MLLVPSLLTLGLAAYGVAEVRRHERQLARIPVRVHVNGTRGKSSVTRLIAAGLRSTGRRVFAKTTGTMARMIPAPTAARSTSTGWDAPTSSSRPAWCGARSRPGPRRW